MYTWEIEKKLKEKNYNIYNDEYFEIINTSPQITCIKYNPYDNSFETWTKEKDNSIHYFKYNVRKRTKNLK